MEAAGINQRWRMIRRDFFKAALAGVAGFFGLRAAKAESELYGLEGAVKGLRPDPGELRVIMCRGKQVRMQDLREGDVFTMDDLEGQWKATGNPYVVEFGGGPSPWGIQAEIVRGEA